ncbi:hypothetical protein ALC62_12318 [Cyphomyrmex costatus]|uniref:Mutator-like transposase domain-containing protein n=1 Tax=Cyphomyrmex costatus TaxID=456900 RepID=A0A151IBH9_9HYME|nr:hypothetical protein ALC62_12318 [Cyphomyrmex costatus]
MKDGKCDREVDESFGYRFINFLTVFSVISQVVVCRECKGDVTFLEGSRRGLGSKIIVKCNNCSDHSINSCPLINDRAYEVNTRMIFAIRLLGIGINGIKKFCAFMDLPKPVFQVTYDKIVSNISIATECVRTLCLKSAAEEEKLLSIEHNNNDGLTVSGDGSWRKRGFSLLTIFYYFYGLAIRLNTESVEKMRNDIWATLYHKISTDEQHNKCPVGIDSWCSWQQSKALGTLSSYQHKPAMHKDVFEAIKPIYKDLSSDDLLSRCLGGYTQNQNESFNAVVWAIAPKTVSSGKTVLDIASDIATITFNEGLSGLFSIYDALGIIVGRSLFDFCMESDANRIKAAERSISEKSKTARRSLTLSRKEQEDQNTNLEGQLYGAGIAE